MLVNHSKGYLVAQLHSLSGDIFLVINHILSYPIPFNEPPKPQAYWSGGLAMNYMRSSF